MVYSTHSVFMIDPGDISRHYLVKKFQETTSIRQAEEDNIASEEVLYNALGTSAFEFFREKNLVFEGWRDKVLFQAALQGLKKETRMKFSDVGVCHARGVNSIRAITPLLEIGQRHCIIVSDGDDAALKQKKAYTNEGGYGEWKTYQDILPGVAAVTGEDFICNAHLLERVNVVLSAHGISDLPADSLPDKAGKLAAITAWLEARGLKKESLKDVLIEIKRSIFDKLDHADIEEEYMMLLDNLSP